MNRLKALKVSENGRFLVDEDGMPFFWLADTAWELFHRLNREEVLVYIKNRAESKFNVIQAVALAELEGLTVPNAYGRIPLLKNERGEYDPSMPDVDAGVDAGGCSYWDHMDFVIDTAAEYGLYIALLPTWGDKYNLMWGKGPVIFDPQNAGIYGRWLGERYRDKTNLIWVLGGDRSLHTHEHFEIVKAMAEGLREGDNGRHLMTFHPMGGFSSSYHLHDEKWMDFNMIQSGHMALNGDNYSKVRADYGRLPVKPVLDAEPRYEDHPVNFNPDNGYFDDYDVRQAAFWAVFSGAFGHTYGHHGIWSMCTEAAGYFPVCWKDALDRPGGYQMQHLKSLMESRSFLDRVPDQNLIAENYDGANYLCATRGTTYAFIYSPNGLKIKVAIGSIRGDRVKASWYDPRTGVSAYIGLFENQGVLEFVPPSAGRGNDWALVLDGMENI